MPKSAGCSTAYALKKAIMVLMVAPILLLSSAAADIYRWQDAKGHWHFSDSPPSDVSAQRIGAESPPSNQAPASPAATPEAHKSPASSAGRSEPVQGGLFWRIGKAGIRPSYLLGTIHVADPRVTHLRPAVQAALDQADSFSMEMIPDASALMSLGSAMLNLGGEDLETQIGSALFSKAAEALSVYGLPEPAVRQLKPWAVMALLSTPKPSDGVILDMALYQRAQGRGIAVSGLESAQEQLAVFETLPLADQIALLRMTVEQLPGLPRLFDQLIEAYAADDLPAIAGLAQSYRNQADLAAFNRFMLQLNDERNRRMVQRMVPMLQQGNAFIAIGALHLAGSQGVIQLLRDNGYTLESIR